MKKIWKVLLGAAALAAVTPYQVQKDEETGKVKVTSVTWSATITKGEGGPTVALKLLPMLNKDEDQCECEDECCCCEDPDVTETPEESEEEGITIEVNVEETPAQEPAAPANPEPTQA